MREYSPSVYIHLKSEDTKSIILPPFCATSVLERVKSYLFVENISSDYIRKENESITFVQPNLEGYQDWRRIIEFGSYLHTLFCTGSTSLTKINEYNVNCILEKQNMLFPGYLVIPLSPCNTLSDYSSTFR